MKMKKKFKALKESWVGFWVDYSDTKESFALWMSVFALILSLVAFFLRIFFGSR